MNNYFTNNNTEKDSNKFLNTGDIPAKEFISSEFG